MRALPSTSPYGPVESPQVLWSPNYRCILCDVFDDGMVVWVSVFLVFNISEDGVGECGSGCKLVYWVFG